VTGRGYGLAPLSLGRPEPEVLVAAAGAAGFGWVGLTLQPPGGACSPLVGDRRRRAELRRRLGDAGVSVCDVGVVVLSPAFDLEELARVLSAGRNLGADRVVVMDRQPDRGAAAALLAAVCGQAGERGMTVAVEFMPYTATRTLAEAVALIEAAGAPEAGVVVDLLHLCRSGSVPQLAGLDPRLVRLVQICDAPLTAPPADRLRDEALYDRLRPGDGELPLTKLLSRLPAGAPRTIEAPVAGEAGLPPGVRARAAFRALAALARG
jgi:sugar phosphate isomerase/epimerase